MFVFALFPLLETGYRSFGYYLYHNLFSGTLDTMTIYDNE